MPKEGTEASCQGPTECTSTSLIHSALLQVQHMYHTAGGICSSRQRTEDLHRRMKQLNIGGGRLNRSGFDTSIIILTVNQEFFFITVCILTLSE